MRPPGFAAPAPANFPGPCCYNKYFSCGYVPYTGYFARHKLLSGALQTSSGPDRPSWRTEDAQVPRGDASP